MKKQLLLVIGLMICSFLFSMENDVQTIENISKITGLQLYLYALFGCIVQEVIYWFELRRDIASGDIPVEWNSKVYWIITVLSILIFSVGTFFYFWKSQDTTDFFTITVFAAGFPRLFKGAVQQLQPMPIQNSLRHPSSAAKAFTIKTYLMSDD